MKKISSLTLTIVSLSILACTPIGLAQSSKLDDAIVELNADNDRMLSSSELSGASAALKSLDTDGNNIIDSEESSSRFFSSRRSLIYSAVDLDSDGTISSSEIDNAPLRLLALDANNSGSLMNDELNINSQGTWSGFGGNAFRNIFRRSTPEPADVSPEDGQATILDRETFKRLSYQGEMAAVDVGLHDLQLVKFIITGANGPDPKTFFMDTKTHHSHTTFMQSYGMNSWSGMGENSGSMMRGVVVYRPLLSLYTFEFEPFDSYDYTTLQIAYDELIKYAPIFEGKLAYHPLSRAVNLYERQRQQFEDAGLDVFLDGDELTNISYLPLNEAEGFGILRLMELDERPSIRDVVLYESLPNEMPHVAGIITGFRQTPLSHVNLRAVQDEVPNAFIKDATENEEIVSLIGNYVYYRVAADGFEIREASLEEVNEHFANIRPVNPQEPERDLSNTTIRSLKEITFSDSLSVGVKAANVATLGSFGLPEAATPKGFAVPFYFYDEFMKHNDFYAAAADMIALPNFINDTDERERLLKEFREDMKEAELPQSMMQALTDLQNAFPADSSIRLRSSTNNEDLPGFSGAGLYDSYTHKPDEGHISKSVKQVFASLWNFRAFEERDFYLINHFSAAMGILVHPNYSDEIANGVAVSDRVVYDLPGVSPGRTYYVNVQLGEDLVTNPEEESIPEEMLLNSVLASNDTLIQTSNRTDGDLLLDEPYKTLLRDYMNRVHQNFRELYGITAGAEFAMEIEFKITVDGDLTIKQARPWVY